MSKKYDMRICKCGIIHMVDKDMLARSLENYENLLLICGGCGDSTLIGTDITPDWNEPDKDCYMIYPGEFFPYNGRSLVAGDSESTEHHEGIVKIIHSNGRRVPMMTGMYATAYSNGRFFDRRRPDFYKIQRSDITVKDIMGFIDEYTHDSTIVNMNRFIHETPEDILEEISHYHIVGFNWKDTKWETKWNSK